MQFRKQIRDTGNIPVFSLVDEFENINNFDKDKPSSNFFLKKRAKKTIAVLKDLEINHNHSWYAELYMRAKDNMDALALFYRANKISFKEMFDNADNLARALVEIGVGFGDEVPICLSNVPEAVYTLLALNRLGSKVNSFGATYDEDYIDEILDSCSHKVIFITDDCFEKVIKVVNKHQFEHIVVISLADSLPEHPETMDEYEPEYEEYYHINNCFNEFKSLYPKIEAYKDFTELGINNDAEILDAGNLDTEFLVTYTSGSTKIGHPKAIVHRNRSLITMGRFHDPEASGNPKIAGLRALAAIHLDSNTEIITNISDSLMQLWSVALEPLYSIDTVYECFMINKPNYCALTTSFWLSIAKRHMKNGYSRLPFLLAAFAVGESLSKGEELFLNNFLKKVHAGSGIKIKGISLPSVPMSVGGGDCEHGGIYYTLWKKFCEKLNCFRLGGDEYGLIPVPFAVVSAFAQSEDGTFRECNYNEIGMIAANSPTTMSRYKNNVLSTEQMVITDEKGRDWISCNVHGYIDKIGGVHIKGRLENCFTLTDGTQIPLFKMDDLIEQDFKNILSCSVVGIEHNKRIIPVINLQLQSTAKKSKEEVIESIRQKFKKEFPLEIIESMRFRVFEFEDSMPLTASGKRGIRLLEEMELEGIEE